MPRISDTLYRPRFFNPNQWTETEALEVVAEGEGSCRARAGGSEKQ